MNELHNTIIEIENNETLTKDEKREQIRKALIAANRKNHKELVDKQKKLKTANSKHREYRKEWMKNNKHQICLKFDKEKDAEVVQYLKTRENITAYLRELITNDMNK